MVDYYPGTVIAGRVAVRACLCQGGVSGLVHFGIIEVVVAGGTVIVRECSCSSCRVHVFVFPERDVGYAFVNSAGTSGSIVAAYTIRCGGKFDTGVMEIDLGQACDVAVLVARIAID